jgi:hypothetical protein
MRFLVLAVLLMWAAVARAEPGDADAAVELRLFLSNRLGEDYRVLNFRVLDHENVGPVRRHIRYLARVEFPHALSLDRRALLAREDVQIIEGKMDVLSSARLVVELRREARFIHTEHGWVVQIDTTRYPLARGM